MTTRINPRLKVLGVVLCMYESTARLTGEVVADGAVRIQRDEQIWVGEHIRYNFKTRQMEAEQFRTGKPPVFAAGQYERFHQLLKERIRYRNKVW